MTARNEDFLFAQEAQNLGYVSEAQVEEGFLLQRRMTEDLQIDERLAVILVKRGWLAEEQARRVYGIIEPKGAGGQIEGYRLVEIIGRGAMGTVYKAIHEGLHRVVALKILRRDLATDKTQIERLKREAKLLADLDHPNIVRAFDAGESNGYPYLVMEYVEGETLRERITRDGALSNEKALRITRSLADALEKARRMGIVHRDVKPGNILLSKSGVPKLMDLGLAKGPIDMGLTQHGATVGTPQFISPEQAQDPRKADTRSDIYSLGATLYAMVTTRPPYEGATLAEIITKVLYRQPTPPRVRNPEVSPEVAHLIERMMLKDPTLRYQTPAQVVADVDMIRGGQSIVPKGFRGNWEAHLLRQRQRTWIRRSAIGLVAGALLVIGGLNWLDRRAREAAQHEVDGLATQVLALRDVQEDDTVPKIRELEETAKDLKKRMVALVRSAGVRSERMEEVDARIRYYAGSHRALYAYAQEKVSIDQNLRDAIFEDSLRRVALQRDDAADYPVAVRRYDELAAAIRNASAKHWRARQAQVLAGTARDLQAWADRWRDFHAALDGKYHKSVAYDAARREAAALATAALNILTEVNQLKAAYSAGVIKPRIEARKFYELKTELHDHTSGVLSAVEGHWEAFRVSSVANVPKPLLFGENGYIRRALKQIESGVDDAVEAAAQALIAQIPVLETDVALQKLRDFEDGAARGNYFLELSRRMGDLHKKLDAQRKQREQAAQVAYAATREAVLAALRAGDAAALSEAVEYALERRPLSAAGRTEVNGLRVAAAALNKLHEGAIAYLQTVERKGQSLNNVRRRGPDGTTVVEKRLSDIRVDAERRRFHARIQRRGSRREDVTILLEAVALRQLQTWANLGSEGAGEPLLRGLIELARLQLVRDEPGKDLRTLRKQYAPLLDTFDALERARAWAGVVRGLMAELDVIQEKREALATGLITRIEVLNADGRKPLLVNLLYDQLSDEKGKTRFSDAFHLNVARLEKMNAIALRELAEQELLRLVPGAQVVELSGGRTRIVFDFDDELQLPNFERGFGVLEPFGGAITPIGNTPQRLHLLKGVRGLLRDRPLSLYSMFDPCERIVVEFTLWTLRASFLVGVDIDGVQLAVCSADPNYWKWYLREDAPLLSGEESLPEFDFYGRGRGIAFHEGTTFGAKFPLDGWEWPVRGHGRYFKRWQDKAYLDKRQKTLFAFEPGRKYRVKVVRDRDEIQFWVDGDLIVQRRKASWAQRGATSEKDAKVRHGSGRLQILTWTPMAIDNLRLEGRIMERWRRMQKQRLARDEGKKKDAKDGGKADGK